MPPFVRWVPREFAATAIAQGLVSHNTSAMWIFDLAQAYRPGSAISRNAILIAYDLDQTAVQNVTTHEHVDFEDPEFGGEAGHPREVIVKSNEVGAYGLGKLRQTVTNLHATTWYATRREAARALGLSEMEVTDANRPATGWP